MLRHPPFQLKVVEGQIHLNSIWAYVLEKDVFVVEADCQEKYPEIGAYSGEEVSLYAGEDTLGTPDLEARGTVVHFEGLPGHWVLEASVSKYSVRITGYRIKPMNEITELWTREEG